MVITTRVVNDPYYDWYQVYRSEVVDRIKHWPVATKRDAEKLGSIEESNAFSIGAEK